MSAHRLSGEPPGKGEFCVPSRTFPGEHWTVIWISEGLAYCGCHGFSHRQECRHVAEVALAIEIEARDLVQGSTAASRAEAQARLEHIEKEFSL